MFQFKVVDIPFDNTQRLTNPCSFSGSPASRDNLRINDEILEVNGVSVVNDSHVEVIEKIHKVSNWGSGGRRGAPNLLAFSKNYYKEAFSEIALHCICVLQCSIY